MRLYDVEQGSGPWFEIRSGLPTASEFSRIVTATGKPSASADAYIAELIDEAVRPMSSRSQEEQAAQFSGNRHTERGHDFEPKARQWFEFVHGVTLEHVGFVTTDDGALGCSPDAVIREGGKLIAGVEAKAPEGKKHVLWMMGGALPDEHKQQVHGSMVVTGLRSWWFISYCPGYKPFAVRVDWDDYTTAMQTQLAAFAERKRKALEQFTDYIQQQKAA